MPLLINIFMKKSKKILFIVMTILIVIAIAIICILLGYFSPMTVIPKGKQNFCYVNGHIVLESNYIFDTGADISVLYEKEGLSIPVAVTLMRDIHKNKRCRFLYFVNKKSLFQNEINHFVCLMDSGFYRPDKSVKGIIGMNVIQRANWHFSFLDSTVEVFSRRASYTIPSKALCFKYNNRLIPCSSIDIESEHYKQILIDMGYSLEFLLDENNISQIQKCCLVEPRQELITGLLGHQQVDVFQYDTLSINGNHYSNVRIDGGKRNLIGLGFMRRFDHLFWDSRHKKVYLWNEEK